MKKTTLFITVFSLLFCTILTAVLAWYGYFSTVSVREKPVGPYTLVYKVYVGSSSGVGPLLTEIRLSLINEFRVHNPIGFGLYYDDPKTTPAGQCRILVGCIVEDDQDGDMRAISEKYSVARFPRGMAVVADYPYRNNLSVLFGMLRGYPALLAYVDGHQLPRRPVLEMYDASRGRIRYVLSTAFSNDFLATYLDL